MRTSVSHRCFDARRFERELARLVVEASERAQRRAHLRAWLSLWWPLLVLFFAVVVVAFLPGGQ